MLEASTQTQPSRSRPARSRDTDFFWEGLREHRLLLQQCGACGVVRHPPTPSCPSCHSFVIEHIESTGRGTVHSYTVHHHPPIPGFTAPFVVALVDLEEGIRLVANVSGPVESVRVDLPVVVEYEDQPDGWTVPVFRPAELSEA